MTTYTTLKEAETAASAKSEEMLSTWDIIDFDGNNCSDSWDEGAACDGWDGNERRCECGNRRVGWAFTEYPKGVWTFYAEAY